MARRPDREKEEILSEKDLEELRHNLAHLSVTAVRDFYEQAYQGIADWSTSRREVSVAALLEISVAVQGDFSVAARWGRVSVSTVTENFRSRLNWVAREPEDFPRRSLVVGIVPRQTCMMGVDARGLFGVLCSPTFRIQPFMTSHFRQSVTASGVMSHFSQIVGRVAQPSRFAGSSR
jgi:hypothetical protein